MRHAYIFLYKYIDVLNSTVLGVFLMNLISFILIFNDFLFNYFYMLLHLHLNPIKSA